MGSVGLGPVLFLSFLFGIGRLQWAVSGQAVGVGLSDSRVAFQTVYMRDYLVDPTVSEIYLAGPVIINSTNWVADDILLLGNRSVIIQPAIAGAPAVINFGGRANLLMLGSGGNVTFANLVLNNTASLTLDPDNILATRRAVGFALWPSIILQPNSTVVFYNTTTYFYSLEAFTPCVHYIRKVKATYDSLYGEDATQLVGTTGIFISGRRDVLTDIVDGNGPAPVGYANIVTDNATAICVDSGPVSTDTVPKPRVFRDKFTLAYALILGFGTAAIILLGGLACCLWHRNRQLGIKTLRLSSALRKGHQDPEGGGVPGPPKGDMDRHSGPSQGDGRGSNASVGTEAFSSDRDPKLAPSRRSLESNRSMKSNSSANAVQPRLSLPDLAALLRARSADVLGNVEMGPLIGRGAFGRVYKAKWNGVFVAVKVVEHNAETGSMLNTLRESALSQSIAHPNVVTTYKILTIRSDANGAATKVTEGIDAQALARSVSKCHQSDSAETSKGHHPASLSGDRIEHQLVETGKGELAVVPRGSHLAQQAGQATTDSPERSESSFHAQDAEVQETWMILEFCDKGTLEQAITAGRFKQKGKTECDYIAVLACLKDIASGMEYLHSLGVLHGDLKPANVMLKSVVYDARRYICKLADFGLSRVLGDLASHVSTRTYGTISFMPPELIRDAKLSKATDVYSYGILMWETYLSRTAYEGVPAATVFYMVAVEDRRPPVEEDMPPPFRALMEQCWDTDPDKRPIFSDVLRRVTAMWEAARIERAAARTGGQPSPQRSEVRDSVPHPAGPTSSGEGGGGSGVANARLARRLQLRTIASINRTRSRKDLAVTLPSIPSPASSAEGPITAQPSSALFRFSQGVRAVLLARRSTPTAPEDPHTPLRPLAVAAPPGEDDVQRAIGLPRPPSHSYAFGSVEQHREEGNWRKNGEGQAGGWVAPMQRSVDKDAVPGAEVRESEASRGWATAKLRSASSQRRHEAAAAAAVREADGKPPTAAASSDARLHAPPANPSDDVGGVIVPPSMSVVAAVSSIEMSTGGRASGPETPLAACHAPPGLQAGRPVRSPRPASPGMSPFASHAHSPTAGASNGGATLLASPFAADSASSAPSGGSMASTAGSTIAIQGSVYPALPYAMVGPQGNRALSSGSDKAGPSRDSITEEAADPLGPATERRRTGLPPTAECAFTSDGQSSIPSTSMSEQGSVPSSSPSSLVRGLSGALPSFHQPPFGLAPRVDATPIALRSAFASDTADVFPDARHPIISAFACGDAHDTGASPADPAGVPPSVNARTTRQRVTIASCPADVAPSAGRPPVSAFALADAEDPGTGPDGRTEAGVMYSPFADPPGNVALDDGRPDVSSLNPPAAAANAGKPGGPAADVAPEGGRSVMFPFSQPDEAPLMWEI